MYLYHSYNSKTIINVSTSKPPQSTLVFYKIIEIRLFQFYIVLLLLDHFLN